MSDREEGWYWVLISEGSEWECSKYENGKFLHTLWGWVHENELLEIGDKITHDTKSTIKELHSHSWIDTGRYSYCTCGDLMVKDGSFTKQEIDIIRKEIKEV